MGPSPPPTASTRARSAEARARYERHRRAARVTTTTRRSAGRGADTATDTDTATGGAGSPVFGAIGPPGSTLPGFTGAIPGSIEELFATLELVNHEGDPVVAKEAFENKVVGVYFSASRCPACVRFSPTLDAFTERNAADYVTVLVPGDEDEESAARYHKTLGANFLSVPFGSIHRTLLMTAYRVYAIPALHVWHVADAKHVTAWGHTAVTRAPETCVRDWHAPSRGGAGSTSRGCPSRGGASPWGCPARFANRCSPRKEAPRKREEVPREVPSSLYHSLPYTSDGRCRLR